MGMGREAVVLHAVSCLPLASCCWAARSELNGHQGSHHQRASQPAVWNLTSREGAALAGRRHRAGEIAQRLTGQACSGSALKEGDISRLERGLPW